MHEVTDKYLDALISYQMIERFLFEQKYTVGRSVSREDDVFKENSATLELRRLVKKDDQCSQRCFTANIISKEKAVCE